MITPFITGEGTHLVGNLLLQHQVDDAAGEVAALQVAVDVHAARGAGAVSTICEWDVMYVYIYIIIYMYIIIYIHIFIYMNKNYEWEMGMNFRRFSKTTT